MSDQGTPTLPRLDLKRAWHDMTLIRRFEERCAQLYSMGLIGGFCHLYIGQEAIVIGMENAIREGDQVITGYRDHAFMLACGMDPKRVMAELTGRSEGYSGGKGGSMHMFSLNKDFYGGHGIVAAQVPIGTGLGFANHYRGNDRVALVYFGDGAANQGQVYESLNMAKLWNLPIVYIIENNLYAMGTSLERSTAQKNLSKRGEGFGIKGRQVDGMDVEAVYAAGAEAVAQVRAGGGPALLEMITYRYRGHSMSDPARYRPREEVDQVRKDKDPLTIVKDRLTQRHLAREEDLKEMQAHVKSIIAEAAEFAQQSPPPDRDELYKDVLIKTEND